MNGISLPFHLITPAIISIFILGVIFLKRSHLFNSRRRRWYWICLTVFFVLYLLIVIGAAYTDISLQLKLRAFDLDGNGFFSGNEITAKQEAVTSELIADTGRTFSFITGLIFSGLISIPIFVIGRIYEYKKRND